jgi:hypothetical protein
MGKLWFQALRDGVDVPGRPFGVPGRVIDLYPAHRRKLLERRRDLLRHGESGPAAAAAAGQLNPRDTAADRQMREAGRLGRDEPQTAGPLGLGRPGEQPLQGAGITGRSTGRVNGACPLANRRESSR